MRVAGVSCIVGVLICVGFVAQARADIILSTNQGSINPDENVLFNGPGTTSGPDLTVTGATNQTGILVSFTGTENLITPSQGQARITDEGVDGFNFLEIALVNPLSFFSEFEANIKLFPQTSGNATIEACNQLGDPCTQFSPLGIGGGQNFFVLSVIFPQLIDIIRITSSVPMMDLRQIRVSVQGEETTLPVSEPALLALMGVALLAGGRRFSSRRFSR